MNASGYDFTVEGTHGIRYGLGAVRGVGAQAVESLVAERTAQGPSRWWQNGLHRVRSPAWRSCVSAIDLGRVNRRVLEALIRSGSLDGLGANRATLMAGLDAAVQGGEQNMRASAAGQVDLFGGSGSAPVAAAQGEWSESVRLAGERETLGLYLTGHPIQRYESDLPRLVSARIRDLVSERAPVDGRRRPL